MRKVREVLRLKHECGRSEREIALAVAVGRSTVGEYLARAKACGLTWEIAKELDDAAVEARLFRHVGRSEPAARAPIDFAWVHMELRRPGVTRQLLWTEYAEHAAAGGSGWRPYQYSQFCDLYEAYRSKLQPSMRQVHRAGEKAFIDFSGNKPSLVDLVTGEATEVELFVMVLGASNYTYAEATRTQRLGDFVGATVRGLHYFGAVPEILTPDQLRSAVSMPPPARKGTTWLRAAGPRRLHAKRRRGCELCAEAGLLPATPPQLLALLGLPRRAIEKLFDGATSSYFAAAASSSSAPTHSAPVAPASAAPPLHLLALLPPSGGRSEA